MFLREVRLEDAAEIAEIFNYYALHTTFNFETEAVKTGEMTVRIQKVLDHSLPWLVAESEGRIIGYSYANRWRERGAYLHTVETSIYLRHNAVSKGLGRVLYEELLRILRHKSMHVLIALITVPNDASVAFHKKFGFEKVGQFREIGWKFKRWVDLECWELILPQERKEGRQLTPADTKGDEERDSIATPGNAA